MPVSRLLGRTEPHLLRLELRWLYFVMTGYFFRSAQYKQWRAGIFMDCMLGIDLGTSALKAAVFDVQGTCIGNSEATLERISGCSGNRHLHDPREWWVKAVAAIRPLLASLDQDYRLRAIACCGFH